MSWAVFAPLVGGLVAINLITFALFAIDKARAAVRKGRRPQRIAERTLLLWAACGGSPAAFAARRLLRHKTRKQPFVARLWLIAVVQVGLLGACVWFILRR